MLLSDEIEEVSRTRPGVILICLYRNAEFAGCQRKSTATCQNVECARDADLMRLYHGNDWVLL